MAIDRDRKYRDMAARGKYHGLYVYLRGLPAQEWRTTFAQIESIVGFALPASARLHRPWWANRSGASRHGQALAWSVAGWETAEVDMDSETLLLRRSKPPQAVRRLSLDEVWPVHPSAVWPKGGLNLRREDIYAHRG